MSGGEQNMKKQNLLTDFFESLNDKKIAHKLYKDINKECVSPTDKMYRNMCRKLYGIL